MESLIIAIAAILAAFNLSNFTIDVPTYGFAENSGFPHHLLPADRISFPYRLRGTPKYDPALISAESVIVVDVDSGRVLFEKDSYANKSIASLTKLMSALVWWEIDGNLNKAVKIKGDDYREGSIPYFISGERVTTGNLLNAALIASSNSAVAALVRSTGLTEDEFVDLMNKKAEALGMYNTRFKEPTGLNFKNISTATDLYILSREVFQNPILSTITRRGDYTFLPEGKILTRHIKSTNQLLDGPMNKGSWQIVGGKTGYIEESNYNLALEVRNREKKKNIIVIILGSRDQISRFAEAREIVNWAFTNHIWNI